MKILITGAAGFIGLNLTKFLINKGYDVLALTRRFQADDHLTTLNFSLINIDIRELQKQHTKDIDVDLIFHLAGLRGEGRGTKEVYHDINVEGTRKLLEAFGHKLKRFIYCSSVSVYGHPAQKPANEEVKQVPTTIYGWSKYKAEELVQEICNNEGIPLTIIRPVITYGPYDFDGMVTKLFKMIDSRFFIPVGNGDNRIHLVYISDLIEAFHLAMKSKKTENEIFIIAGKKPIRISELIALVSAELNKGVPRFKIPIKFAKMCGFCMENLYKLLPKIFSGEPLITRDKVDILTVDRSYSIDKAVKLLGFKPKVDYKEGIRRTAQWLRENRIIRH